MVFPQNVEDLVKSTKSKKTIYDFGAVRLEVFGNDALLEMVEEDKRMAVVIDTGTLEDIIRAVLIEYTDAVLGAERPSATSVYLVKLLYDQAQKWLRKTREEIREIEAKLEKARRNDEKYRELEKRKKEIADKLSMAIGERNSLFEEYDRVSRALRELIIEIDEEYSAPPGKAAEVLARRLEEARIVAERLERLVKALREAWSALVLPS